MSSQLSISVPLPDAGAHSTRISRLGWLAIIGAVIITGLLIFNSVTGHHAAAPDSGHHGPPDGYQLPAVWACAPFVLLLLCIAVLPLIPATAHWWEHNVNRLLLAVVLGAATLGYYAWVHPMTYNHTTHQTYTGFKSVVYILEHAVLAEYIPFIVLLFSLYVISGGISLRGDLAARPMTNTAFLAVGGLLASFIGTTGASMLLIRPLLQTNSERRRTVHTVIFFIFLVSNCGGLLLPIGDPPLFLGYLRGVPFMWTFSLFWEWLFVGVALLAIYFVWDTLAYRKETPRDITRDETRKAPLRLKGSVNFLWLIGVVFCVALVDPTKELPLLGFKPFPFMRELLMMGCVLLSLRTTGKGIRESNQFNYHAILEVAALFIGIFVCMQVPIEILNGSGEYLKKVMSAPAHFFWATGGLSSCLDNAPTYVVFFATAGAMTPEGAEGALQLADGSFIIEAWLVAISLGAVFMGAMTYIGNGPNFMVKSIAEQSGVKMPSFFGYMLYSVAVLVPLLVLVNLIFLRG
ncbi:MAG: sodium:proton antiporter [bacterium]|nr:sodium:proton antiporter [bacterium]